MSVQFISHANDELNKSLIADSFTPLSDELEKAEDRKDDPE